MEKTRHLKAPGKGEFLYDYKHDILTFKIKDRDYKMSVEFQNFIIDIDTEDFVTGIRILDASKVSGLNKIVFQNMMSGKFEASIQDNIISVRINFVGVFRNKLKSLFPEKENFTQQFSVPSNENFADSIVTVPKISA